MNEKSRLLPNAESQKRWEELRNSPKTKKALEEYAREMEQLTQEA